MKPIDLLLLIINISFTAFSNIILKFSTLQKNKHKKLFFLMFGFGIYFLMSFITIYFYKRYSLVLIQGLLTITYIVTPIFAYIFYKERLPKKIWIGIFMIILGIVLIGIGETKLD